MPGLALHQKWVKEEVPLKEKDVVLISDDNIPRGKWRIGKVTETFPGKDRRICTVRLKTKKGMINRPVQKLHLLEEHKEQVFSDRFLPLDATEVQRDEKPLEVQRNEDPQEVQRVKNDDSSFVGEDLQADVSYITQYGRACRCPRRL